MKARHTSLLLLSIGHYNCRIYSDSRESSVSLFPLLFHSFCPLSYLLIMMQYNANNCFSEIGRNASFHRLFCCSHEVVNRRQYLYFPSICRMPWEQLPSHCVGCCFYICLLSLMKSRLLCYYSIHSLPPFYSSNFYFG